MRYPTRGIFRGCCTPFPRLRDFPPGFFVSPRVVQAAVVQLPCGAVSSAHSPSLPQRVSPHIGELHTPILHNVQSSRLDIFRDGYQGEGFSVCAASFLAQSVWLSTSLVYDRKWVTFCIWCTERQIDPVSLSIGNLGDFLIHLYESQNVAASTVRAYKAAILSALAPRRIFTPAQLGMLINCATFSIRGGCQNLLFFLHVRGIFGSCSAGSR